VAIELAPEKADQILVAELERPTAGCQVCLDLIALSGLAHWDIIKAATVREPSANNVHTVIPAVAKLGTPAARHALGELLAALSLETAPDPRDVYPGETVGIAGLLADFAAAATAIGGQGVVAKDALERARRRFARGKGGRLTPEDVTHNDGVPEARRQIVKQLSEFFAREK
jgi:hypothetical protein